MGPTERGLVLWGRRVGAQPIVRDIGPRRSTPHRLHLSIVYYAMPLEGKKGKGDPKTDLIWCPDIFDSLSNKSR